MGYIDTTNSTYVRKFKIKFYIIFLMIVTIFYLFQAFDTSNTNIFDSAKASKYEDANWEKIHCHQSSSMEDSSITPKVVKVRVRLGNLDKDTIKKYKVVKIVYKIYQRNTNELIGECERYYENVTLSTYGYWDFSRDIKIKLSKRVDRDDYTLDIEAYGVRE